MLPASTESGASGTDRVHLHWALVFIPPFVLPANIYSMPTLSSALRENCGKTAKDPAGPGIQGLPD